MYKNPTLKFNLDKTFDYWTCNNFLDFTKKDDFTKSILFNHPKLNEFNDPNINVETSTKNYIDRYYLENNELIENSLNEAIKDWENIYNNFFKTANEYFQNMKGGLGVFPLYKYDCFLSIFNVNPRFIEKGEFQFFFKHEYSSNYICVHEMLHFAFYNYLKVNYPNEYKSREENYMWKLSEIVNDVILRDKEFVNITEIENPGIYAQSKNELAKYLGIWNDNKNIDTFLNIYFENN